MAKGEFVLNIGDDNVVLVRLVDKKVVNAWLGSPDPALAQEELGEALSEDSKAKISIIIDTLDQAVKEEEIPKVGILDRRKILARHINMAFPGMNLRGARLIEETAKKTFLYQFASVPLEGRIPGWIDFVQSLANPKGGIYTLATENVDIIQALTQKDVLPTEEGKNHWRHLIGVNVTGGLRQIIEKNGRLSLTRLTQAPPPETPPGDFADMIVRDFKATITYIRRLGYVVGDALDLVVLTTAENKAALEDQSWDGARSVSFYTPYEAGAVLGLGSIGREDQAYCDVLHAAWFASKRQPMLPLTRSAALGDTKDDIRDLAFVAAPYAAALSTVALLSWTGMTLYEYIDVSNRNEALRATTAQLAATVKEETSRLAALPYDAARMRNVFEVNAALETGKFNFIPLFQKVHAAIQGDAVVMSMDLASGGGRASEGRRPATARTVERPAGSITLNLDMKLPSVITAADEAIRVARSLEDRLNAAMGEGFTVQMTREPIAPISSDSVGGNLLSDASDDRRIRRDEPFYVSFLITGAAK